MKKDSEKNLHPRQLILVNKEVINIGIDLFVETLTQQGMNVFKVDFKPSVKHSSDLAKILEIVSGG